MGHRKQNAPRHGSLRFLPRKRAAIPKGRLRNWSDIEGEPKLLAFAGFKAGMTHLAYIEDQKTSPFVGKELMKAATVIETPPLVIFGIKVYRRDEYGLNPIGEIYAQELAKELGRKIPLPDPEEYKKTYDDRMKALEEKLDANLEIRALIHTQPYKASLPRIKPDIIEIKVTGGKTPRDQFEYLKGKIGTEIRVRDVLREGSMIDVISVSKGKGFQGAAKRFHFKLAPRKCRTGKRRIGCIGPWQPPKVMYTVARYGQLGFANRVEYHKRIMKISEKAEDINPKGGFINYGMVSNDFVLIIGSVPGAKKRLIRLRETIRAPHGFTEGIAELTYISKQSHQGK